MIYKVKLLPQAKLDLLNSRKWYNEQQPGLGKRFLLSTELTFDLLQQNPELFAVRFQTIRSAPVRDFPFLIHYNIDQVRKNIIVFAVLHTSRHTKKLIERINEINS